MTRAADLAKLIAGGGTITVADNSDTLTLESTDADANVGPVLNLHRNSASPADGDLTGRIVFKADDDAGNAATFARIEATAVDVSNGGEDGRLDFFTAKDDAFNAAVSILGTDVGIGTTAPTQKLTVNAGSTDTAVAVFTGNDTNRGLKISTATANSQTDMLVVLEAPGQHSGSYEGEISFKTANTERVRIDKSGNVAIGTTSAAAKLHVESASGSITPSVHADELLVEGSANSGITIGSGTSGLGSLRFADSGGDTRGMLGYDHSDGSMQFFTEDSKAMTIDTDGKVLIGTAQQRGHMTLQIEGDGSASTAQGSIFLRRGLDTSGIGGNVGADLGLIQFGDNDGGIYANIEAKSDASAANNDYPGRLQFGTTADGASSPTERMRIDCNGDVGIGSTTPGGLRLFVTKAQSTGSNVVQFTNTTSSGNVFCVGTSINSNGNNTSSFHVRSVTQGVLTAGLLGNGTQTFTSDERLKKNIETTRDGYLEDLAKLRVVKYNWHNHEEGTPKELGLIAQEVEKVFPNLIRTDDDLDLNGVTDPKSLKASVIPMMLLKGLQEATKRIETLEAEVKTLKGE